MLLLTFICGDATRFRVIASPLRSFAVTLIGHTTLDRTSDQPDAEASNWQTQYSQETNIRASGSIRTHNSSKRVATGIGFIYVDTLICTCTVNWHILFPNTKAAGRVSNCHLILYESYTILKYAPQTLKLVSLVSCLETRLIQFQILSRDILF